MSPVRPLAGGSFPSSKPWLNTTLAIVLAAWALSAMAATIGKILFYYSPLPTQDYWRVVLNLPAYRSLQFGVLWQQHNEHRIVFPEIVFATDMLWAHGCMIVPLALSFLCYSATLLVLSAPVLVDHSIPKQARFIICSLGSVIAFFETATLVLAVPFLLQWTLMQLAAVCAFAFLARGGDKRSISMILLSAAFASIASFSSANGLLVWPVLIAAALLLRIRTRLLVMLSVYALANVVVFFTGYRFFNAVPLKAALIHPGYLLGFVASYLSMPFGGIKSPVFGLSVGMLNLIIALCLLAVAWRKRLFRSRAGVVLFSSYAFVLMTALMTGAGRMDVGEHSFLAAKALRYLSMPQMNWAVLVMLALWLTAKLQWKRIFAIFVALFCVGFSASFIKLDRWLATNTGSFVEIQRTGQEIKLGQFDENQIRRVVYPNEKLALEGLALLKQSNLSVFYGRGRRDQQQRLRNSR
jgi:hypothetical protein